MARRRPGQSSSPPTTTATARTWLSWRAPGKAATTWHSGSRLWMGADTLNSIDADHAAARQGIADYHFIKVLGAGNHGVFYLARRPERLPVSCEFVAVKVLSGASSQDT